VKGTFKPGSHTIFSYAPFLPTSVAFKEAFFLLPIFWCPQKGQRSKVFKMHYQIESVPKNFVGDKNFENYTKAFVKVTKLF
jgi:hypothetical protein